jgi:hypothetical protein
MRVLAVQPGPDFSVVDVHKGWTEALTNLGCAVSDFNLGERLTFYSRAQVRVEPGVYSEGLTPEQAIQLTLNGLYAAMYVVVPEVLLVTSGFYVTAELLARVRAHGTRVVLLHTESPYEDDRQLERAAYADINLINDPTNLEQFRAVAPTWYVPHAYRPSVHHPRPCRDGYRSDFAFVGTGYPSRQAFFERVNWTGLDVALAGNWPGLTPESPLHQYLAHKPDECCDNTEAVDLYAGTKMSANLYRREADRDALVQGWAMGPREVELAATGTFFLREPRGESDTVLSMLPSFSEPEDFGEQVRWWIAHPEQREAAAEQARTAIADRTFTNHAKMLLRLLGA